LESSGDIGKQWTTRHQGNRTEHDNNKTSRQQYVMSYDNSTTGPAGNRTKTKRTEHPQPKRSIGY